MKRKDTLLIIPAYNEEMNIDKVLSSILEQGFCKKMDVLVINDGSSDSTLEKARGYEPDIVVIEQIFNMGYGAALQTGYKYAETNQYSYVIQMDADGQHDLKNLDRILKRLKGECASSGLPPLSLPDGGKDRLPDIIIGSRFLKESESFRISGLKRFAIDMFNGVITKTTGYRLTDPTSGLQGLNRKAFSYYSKYQNFDIYYPDLNMILQMLLLGFHIEEIPAVMHERMGGVSMHTGLWHSMKYMVIMTLSSWNAYGRYHRFYHKKAEKNGS